MANFRYVEVDAETGNIIGTTDFAGTLSEPVEALQNRARQRGREVIVLSTDDPMPDPGSNRWDGEKFVEVERQPQKQEGNDGEA